MVVNQVPDGGAGRRGRRGARTTGARARLVLPEAPLLRAPTVADLVAACDGTLVHGDAELLDRESLGLVVAAMSMPHVIDRLFEGATVIVPGDRDDVVLGVLLAHHARTLPTLSGVVLNGGFQLSPQVDRLIAGLDVRLPIVSARQGTMASASALDRVEGRITTESARKIRAAVALLDQADDADLDALVGEGSAREGAVTPLMFEHDLVERARAAGAHIVLPEGDRGAASCAAADQVLLARHRAAHPARRRGGDPGAAPRSSASTSSGARSSTRDQPAGASSSPTSTPTLRAHKGVTVDAGLRPGGRRRPTSAR